LLRDEYIIASSPFSDSAVENSGAIFIVRPSFEDTDGNGVMDLCVCLPDLNNDASLNFFDISIFLQAFSANDPIADFTNDGLINFFDVSTFMPVFGAGCP